MYFEYPDISLRLSSTYEGNQDIVSFTTHCEGSYIHFDPCLQSIAPLFVENQHQACDPFTNQGCPISGALYVMALNVVASSAFQALSNERYTCLRGDTEQLSELNACPSKTEGVRLAGPVHE